MSYRRYAALLCTTLFLYGCEGGTVKETLGIDRAPPDEFRVVTRPPLSVPPQFTLKPPSSAGAPAMIIPTDKHAETLVLGTADKPSEEKTNVFSLKEGSAETAVLPVEATPIGVEADTKSESQFLLNAGADKMDPHVRAQLEEEKAVVVEQQEESSWWDMLSVMPPKKDPLVDAKKEADRIKANKEQGKPVTEGDTPEVKARDRGILGRILGD